MHSTNFDTLTYAKKLQEAGFSARQAEAQAEALRAVVDENLATKQDLKEMETTLRHEMKEMETILRHDIKEVEATLRHDMKEMETTLRHDMKDMELRLTLRVGAMLAAAVAIIVALMKVL